MDALTIRPLSLYVAKGPVLVTSGLHQTHPAILPAFVFQPTFQWPGEPLLTGLHKVFGPLVVNPLGNTFLAAQLSNAVLAA